MSRFNLTFTVDTFRQNFRNLLEDLEALSASIVSSLAQAILLAGRSGGQGISSSTAADEQFGIGLSDPAYLLDLSAPAASDREVLLHGMVEDASRDRFALMNATTTSSRFSAFILGQVESSSALQALNLQAQTNVSNDTGSTPLLLLMARRYPDAESDTLNSGSYSDIATRPILEIRNRATGLLRVEANGDSKVLLGHLSVETAGKGLKVKEGTNARMGVNTLVAGTVTVNTTAVGSSSRIFLTGQDNSGTVGELTVSARTAGTSFTILSSSATDTRSVAWLIIDPA